MCLVHIHVCVRLEIMEQLEFVHQEFGLQVEQQKDDSTLVNYLLDVAPLYHRICTGDLSVTNEEVEETFGLRVHDPDDSNRPRPPRTELTPFGCPCSTSAHVCVQTELACLLCMTCGRMTDVGFVHPFHDRSWTVPHSTYTYQPRTYFTLLLTRLQGQGHPRFSPRVITAVRRDLTSHGTPLTAVMPTDVRNSLQRLKLGRFYPHRWALTERVNPTYQPLSLSHELYERLQRLFLTCYIRDADQRSSTDPPCDQTERSNTDQASDTAEHSGKKGRERRFVNYHLFILHALQYFGLEDVHVHFTPLKDPKKVDKHVHDIQCLLRGGLAYVFSVAKLEHWTIQECI